MRKLGYLILFIAIAIVVRGTFKYVELVRADMTLELERIGKTTKKKIKRPIRVNPDKCMACHRWGRDREE